MIKWAIEYVDTLVTVTCGVGVTVVRFVVGVVYLEVVVRVLTVLILLVDIGVV